MEYKDFVEQVKDQIQDFLPEKFADATISVHQVVKNNDCVLDGLTIRTEESNISPTVYLNPYFEQIQDGAEMDDVLGQIAATYQAHYIDQDMDVSAVTDFDNVKDKIVCKLINEEANRQFLEDKPYTKVEDLAVVYQILMDKNAEGTATITITDNLMDRYGIILEDLHEQALLNMDVLQSYSFKGMSETIIEMMAGDIARDNDMDISEAREMASQMIPDVPDTMFVLTNDTKVNGAAAILNDDTRQEIADKVGDFYVLPSSVHETLIIPKDAGMELRDLEQMVQEVNQTQVAPQERLSDHVYEYDAKEHELFRSDRAGERAKQKEEKRIIRVLLLILRPIFKVSLWHSYIILEFRHIIWLYNWQLLSMKKQPFYVKAEKKSGKKQPVYNGEKVVWCGFMPLLWANSNKAAR